MLSESRKEQLTNAITEARETIEFLEDKQGTPLLDLSWHILLTYMSSENLVKHSKRLTCWTIVIAITTLALIFSTIAQIILGVI